MKKNTKIIIALAVIAAGVGLAYMIYKKKRAVTPAAVEEKEPENKEEEK